jgi:hypothetical protein
MSRTARRAARPAPGRRPHRAPRRLGRLGASNLGDTGTAEMYRAQVTSLVRSIPPIEYEDDDRIRTRSELTTPRVSQWLATRLKANGDPVSSSYKRKLLYALFSFVAYLREMHQLDRNPIDDIKRPKKGSPKLAGRRSPTTADRGRGAGGVPRAVRVHQGDRRRGLRGARMKRRDVELYVKDRDGYCGLAHVPGTKTDTRDRHDVLIEAWARPYLEAFLRTMLPNASSGRTSRATRRTTSTRSRGGCAVEDYTLRDARHSWAVRARKRGVEFESISEQLGSSVATVHGTYARFKPSLEERHQAQGGGSEPRAGGLRGDGSVPSRRSGASGRAEGVRRLRSRGRVELLLPLRRVRRWMHLQLRESHRTPCRPESVAADQLSTYQSTSPVGSGRPNDAQRVAVSDDAKAGTRTRTDCSTGS